MTGVQVELTDINGLRHRPEHLLSLECDRSWETPADSMELSFICESSMPEIESVRLLIQGREIFFGLADKQTVRRDKGGMSAHVYARGIAAAALDNEALPQVYGRVGLNEIFARHLRPYGFTQLEGSANAYLNGYTVAKGTSDWEAFYNFCNMALSKKPFIRGNRVIIGVPEPEKTLDLSLPDGITAIEHTLERYGVISELWLRDLQGLYSSKVKNPEAQALRIRRKRYIIPDAGWARLPGADARERIRASMLGHSMAKVTLTGLRNVSVGDRAQLSDRVASGTWFVLEVKHTASKAGLTTRLTLCDARYL